MSHDIYLLPIDRAYAEARITVLEKEIQDLGPDFNDAFTQSSETWHDNSPFEAVRDKQSMYAAELHQLRTLIRNSTLVPPRRKRGVINIGDRVTLDNGKHYRLAGDWTHKAGQHRDGVIWVSAGAPLAQQLCGKRVDEVVLLAGKQHKITEIIK